MESIFNYYIYWDRQIVFYLHGLVYQVYSGLYLKRRSHTNFSSYVVGMERETKDLHLELSLRICSCACHMVKSQKKERDN